MANAARIRHNPNDAVSRMMMRLVLLLVLTVLALTTAARLTDRPLEAQPLRGPIVSEQVFHLTGQINGAALVTDAQGDVILRYGPGEAIFISTIDRVIRRERRRSGASLDGPVHLRMREGGRLSIFDPSTARETELASFGDDNIAAFQRILDAR
ncbi:MAG: photosynthetic complex assembly protein PuhC [Pseudomonadota bacterium]